MSRCSCLRRRWGWGLPRPKKQRGSRKGSRRAAAKDKDIVKIPLDTAAVAMSGRPVVAKSARMPEHASQIVDVKP